ncbi:lycopene cyclase [Winogradskyella eckloniae]|uniref:lycopene cyclase family protein n=1 Tax=Winogradskyella eckloniae TaxID=1089306 RepID=UPI001565877C|nr:lycopene cyclase family protein [Winogradskyella eckloniae]NRD21406.1 lycopene cyclase [Winogradskyella eckloniae]
MVTYDYIILGAGASGLLLAYRMANDAFFDDKSILIIDKIKDKGNDRTWCYWEEGSGEWDHLLAKAWPNVYFGSDAFSKTIPIAPYTYKMLRSETFYKALWKRLQKTTHITFVEDDVLSFSELNDGVQVVAKNDHFKGLKLCNSLPNSELYTSQQKYPLIHQHFVGWFVDVEDDTFDDTTATFMDFSVPQNGNTRFMYVLPLHKKRALFEYTLFSKQVLPLTEYENSIKAYLEHKGIYNYKITEKEKGNIPMTAFKFSNLNSKHILNIGTAGGWTKASTGYTFNSTSKKTKEVVSFLKLENDLSKFHKKTKFWFYDLIFLDVLANYNEEGAALFSSMFKKVNIKTIFKFLDEESTWLDDLKIILSVPPQRFIQSVFKRFLS